MQYLLTQEEIEEQRAKNDALDRLPAVEDLQVFCTFVADNLVLPSGWKEGQKWGCILTVKREWYCDDCPAMKVCPHPNKQWSK